MSANTGLLANNIIVQDGSSWETRFQIDAGALTNATRNNFFVEIKGNDVYSFAECNYTGTGALTLSEYNNLPIGSRIFAPGIATPGVYQKISATAFKFQAINS